MTILNVVAIGLFQSIEDRFELLTIKRNKPPYRGNYALPGGKLESGEKLEEAAIRELYEETGIEVEDLQPIALLNEVLYNEDNSQSGHFLVTYFAGVITREDEVTIIGSEEGELQWINLEKLFSYRDMFVPSDFRIILDYIQHLTSMEAISKDVLKSSTMRHYECKLQTIDHSDEDREQLNMIEWESVIENTI